MINELHESAQTRMNQAVEHAHNELATLRTGRANPRMIDQIKVDYYGSPTPIKSLATVSVPEPRLLVIEPFDRSQIGEVEKAIQRADIGMTPNNDGNVIRLQVPELTEERRKDLVKVAHEIVEEGRVAVRNIRRDANNELKTLGETEHISEDNIHRALENFQEITDSHIKALDELLATKEGEILND